MIDRRHFIPVAAGVLLAARLTAFGQQPSKVPRIGFLGSESASNQGPRLEALRAGLRELGHIDGKNILIEVQWAEGRYDQLPALATRLVDLKVAVIVASGAKATRAAKRATTTIPIVMERGDAEEVVASLARPEGNVTGWTYFGLDLTAKRLTLLKECVPRISQAAFLTNPADRPSNLQNMQAAANALKLALRQVEVQRSDEFDRTFAALVQQGCDALVVQGDTMLAVSGKPIAELAIKYRIPSVGIVEYAEAGGLIGYGVDLIAAHRRLATYVDKILKGAKPTDLPVEQATKFELVVNARTAKALGLTIPKELLLRADEVIQ